MKQKAKILPAGYLGEYFISYMISSYKISIISSFFVIT